MKDVPFDRSLMGKSDRASHQDTYVRANDLFMHKTVLSPAPLGGELSGFVLTIASIVSLLVTFLETNFARLLGKIAELGYVCLSMNARHCSSSYLLLCPAPQAHVGRHRNTQRLRKNTLNTSSPERHSSQPASSNLACLSARQVDISSIHPFHSALCKQSKKDHFARVPMKRFP